MAEKMTPAKIWARGEHEGFTPYMIASLINLELKARGLDEIRPQMMYNYDRNGLINGTKRQNDERGYTTAEVTAFIEKFVTMRASKASKAEPQTVEDIQAQIEKLQAKLAELTKPQSDEDLDDTVLEQAEQA